MADIDIEFTVGALGGRGVSGQAGHCRVTVGSSSGGCRADIGDPSDSLNQCWSLWVGVGTVSELSRVHRAGIGLRNIIGRMSKTQVSVG